MPYEDFFARTLPKQRIPTEQPKALSYAVESLENRQMLAGNVVVSVTGGGDLIVNGSDDSNAIGIQTLSPGLFRITGFDETTINGDSDAEIISGVTDDVRINLRSGFNSVIFEDLTIPDLLTVRAENGNDAVIFAGSDIVVGGDMRINLRDGNDAVISITSPEIQVGDDLSIRMGDGDDELFLEHFNVEDRVSINSGAGSDEVDFFDVDVLGQASISLGRGEDLVNFKAGSLDDLRMNGGRGFDSYRDGIRDEPRLRNIEDIQVWTLLSDSAATSVPSVVAAAGHDECCWRICARYAVCPIIAVVASRRTDASNRGLISIGAADSISNHIPWFIARFFFLESATGCALNCTGRIKPSQYVSRLGSRPSSIRKLQCHDKS